MVKKEAKTGEKVTKKQEGGSKMGKSAFGGWAFIIGVVLAVIFGFVMPSGSWFPWLMVVIGLIIGLLNVTDAETQPFLMAGTILVIVSALGGDVFSSTQFLGTILNNNLMLFVPATIIVALKSVFGLARK